MSTPVHQYNRHSETGKRAKRQDTGKQMARHRDGEKTVEGCEELPPIWRDSGQVSSS